jgi:hypothetical protein
MEEGEQKNLDNQETGDVTTQETVVPVEEQEAPPVTNGVDERDSKIKELEEKLGSSLDKINKQTDLIKLLEQRSANVSNEGGYHKNE